MKLRNKSNITKRLAWVVAIFAIVMLPFATIWISHNRAQIQEFTLLTRPNGIAPPTALAGSYHLVERSGWSCPFQESDIAIIIDADGLEVLESENSNVFKRHRFTFGRNLWTFDGRTIEFGLDRSQPYNPILPGFSRKMNEGTIRLEDDGILEVKSVFWQKGMIFYLVPFYEQFQTNMVFHKVPNKFNP